MQIKRLYSYLVDAEVTGILLITNINLHIHEYGLYKYLHRLHLIQYVTIYIINNSYPVSYRFVIDLAEFEVQERLLPIFEPSTIDFDPPPTATNYGSTEQHRIVHI